MLPVTIRAIALVAAVVGQAPSAPTPLPPNVRLFSAGGAAPIVLPAVFDGRVLLKANVAGKMLWLHLDTGTSSLVLDGSEAASLGVVADSATRYSQPLAVSIGPVTAIARFTVLDSYGFDYDGLRVSGLLGGPFFHANVVTIDYQNRRVLFYPPGTFTPPKGVAPTPIELEANCPTVAGTVGSKGGRFLIDTGASITELSPDFAKDVRLGLYGGNVETWGGGFQRETAYSGPALAFGGVTVQRPRFFIPNQPRVPLSGIIGRDILSQFRITFDYADQVMYFEHP